MSFHVMVPEELSRYLNDPAVRETEIWLNIYAIDLLKEASRLETRSGSADKSAEPQITSFMISDADLLLRRGYRKPPKSFWLTAGKIISPLGAVLIGFFADTEKLKEPLLLAVFLILVITTVTATVLVVAKE
jgi:hypothetical protein